jgi:hypothetical protein
MGGYRTGAARGKLQELPIRGVHGLRGVVYSPRTLEIAIVRACAHTHTLSARVQRDFESFRESL